MPFDSPRLTSTSFVVLGLIDYKGPSTPYDLKRAIEQSVENFWPVPHTTFYAEPARLAAAGYLSEQQEPGGRRRRLYSLTDRGAAALREWVSAAEAAPPQLRDEAMLKIFFGADPKPLLRARVRWHSEKLAELEGYLNAVRQGESSPGVERSLVGGTAYHRMLLDLTARYLEGLGQGRDLPATARDAGKGATPER